MSFTATPTHCRYSPNVVGVSRKPNYSVPIRYNSEGMSPPEGQSLLATNKKASQTRIPQILNGDMNRLPAYSHGHSCFPAIEGNSFPTYLTWRFRYRSGTTHEPSRNAKKSLGIARGQGAGARGLLGILVHAMTAPSRMDASKILAPLQSIVAGFLFCSV